MKRKCFLVGVFFMLCVSIFAQKNILGVHVGMSNYGNPFLLPNYQGKYAIQNGKSFDVELSYARFSSDMEKDIAINVGITQRSKYILGDSVPHDLQQLFLSMQAIHHHTIINIVEDKLSLRLGTGVYWNMLLVEWDEFLDSKKDTNTRSSGEINNIGVLLDFPLDIRLNNHQYFLIGCQFNVDFITSVNNSNLFNWKPYLGMAYRF